MTGSVRSDGCDLYYEEAGHGVPILLVPPSGATASTWGPVVGELARVGRVITYDRRGYARSGGPPVRSVARHTADAAAVLEVLRASPAVVVGTSAGATIAVDLAVRRPDLVQAVIAHEAAWRASRHRPNRSQVVAVAKIGWFTLRGRHADAAETLLRAAYAHRDGSSSWDAFPEQWRSVARDNARSALQDFRNSVGDYPTAAELAAVTVPVVCSHGTLSPANIAGLTQSLATVIPTARVHRVEGAGHAAAFDAPEAFVQLVADVTTSGRRAAPP
jgi:pimeloyl-ACP methyl ester carboxylesterase